MTNILHGLNEAQLAAVTGADGPAMVIAGAGSGKTRVLTTRIAYLLEQQKARPWEILALTFTNKAAGEMKERIASMLGEEYVRELWMGTFHSVFARILRRNAEHLGFTSSFSIYDTDDSLAATKRVMEALQISKEQYNPKAVRSRISSAKNQMITPTEYEELARDSFSEKVARIYPVYQKALHEANAMDFDDLLTKTIELFTRFEDVRLKYADRFRYVLVDEYQDTNRVQFTVVKQLTSHHQNLTVVGDDAQSIYAFRGADIRNILDFERVYPNTKLFRLEQNYRSTQNILTAADTLIKNNRDQISKTLFTKNNKGEPVHVIECSDDREEGAAVVRGIEDEIRKEKYQLSEFAVLYRTNAQSRILEDALRRQGIPYTIIGGVAFYKRKEIKDVLAYIRLTVNPADNESLLRVINYPGRGIGEVTIAKLTAFARERGVPILEILAAPEMLTGISSRSAQKLREFAELIARFSTIPPELSAGEHLRALIDATEILQDLKTENTMESLVRFENVKEFQSAITEYFQENPDASVQSYLEEISLMSDVDASDGAKNAVTLMTLHAAKGLEYPVVFITGLEEGLFPNPNTSFDDFSIEEERRLMYVGVTRAMKKCNILYARSRSRFGEFTNSLPSRFIKEITASGATEQTTSYGTRIRSSETTRGEILGSPVFNRSTTINGRTFASRKQSRTSEGWSNYAQESAPNEYSQIEQSSTGLRRGARVYHESFGEGRVVEVSGSGDKAKAVVDFQKQGRKNLMLKYANLRVL